MRASLHSRGGRPSIAALNLSALSLEIVVALGQRPSGMGAGELARITRGAPTSIQNQVRGLVGGQIVARDAGRLALNPAHPARAELVALGLRLAPPRIAMRLVVSANPAVEFATVDDGGFVMALSDKPAVEDLATLDTALAIIRRDRADVPMIVRFSMEDLARILRSAVGLRTRIAAAELLKGVRRTGPSGAMHRPFVPGRGTRIR